jgi:Hom_end-associated Hint
MTRRHFCVKRARRLPQKCMPCSWNSFTPETHVLMADGSSKEIEDVVVGNKVLATDPETGRTEAREVVALIAGEGEKQDCRCERCDS